MPDSQQNSLAEKDLDTFIPEGVDIKIGDKDTKKIKTFHIQEFVIETRTKFLRVVADILKDVNATGIKFTGENQKEIAIAFIKVASEKVENIYVMVLDGVNIEWIRKNVTMKKEIEIFKALMEVNDLPFLLKEIQGIYKKDVTEKK